MQKVGILSEGQTDFLTKQNEYTLNSLYTSIRNE